MIPGRMSNSQTSAQIRPVDRAFFARDPRRVARELLGKVLVRREAVRQEAVQPGVGQIAGKRASNRRLTARIVEVEAYLGQEDPAAHAAAGLTARNAVLFGPPGHAYVYFIYGNHYCLNVSCEPEGQAGSVLFRALEPLSGLEAMAQARSIEIHGPGDVRKLTSGPGRLAEAFDITRARDNGCDLTSAAGALWLGDDGYPAGRILVTPRVGITKAPDWLLRFVLADNPFVSGKRMSRITAAA